MIPQTYLCRSQISFGSSSNNVPHARKLTINPSSFTITPWNDDAVALLTQECPCSTAGSIWRVNQTVK